MDKILVIDDSAVQAQFLCSILQADYDVTACHTAKEGLQMAKEGGYALILLDVIMPDMDGFAVLKELKAAELTRYIPVILLTSLADVQYEERGLLLGAVDYVAKPFNPVIIKARVNTHIKLYQYRKQIEYQSMTDQLTGVANRRRHDRHSLIKWQEAARLQIPFSVCIFDIDNFKKYNDTFGHQAGDHVIVSVAKTAAAFFQRSTDLFARYGGEEFVAVFAGNDGEAAFSFMKTVRQAVEVILHVERYKWQIYTPNFGTDYDGLLGTDPGYAASELRRRLEDAFLPDNRTLGLEDFQWHFNGVSLTAAFTVRTVFGDVPGSMEVPIK